MFICFHKNLTAIALISTAALLFLTAVSLAQTNNPSPEKSPDSSDSLTVPITPTASFAQGTVLLVNNDAVTSTEVLTPLLNQMTEWSAKMDRRRFINRTQSAVAESTASSIRNLLLYQYALKDLEKNENFSQVIEMELEKKQKELIARFGGSEAHAQAELARIGTNIDDQLLTVKKNMVISAYQETYFIPTLEISRSQLLRYYRTHQKDKYYQKPAVQFQLIDIQAIFFLPEGTSNPTLDQLDQAQTAAREQARNVWQKIQDGADFTDMVHQYSNGYRKSSDGLWRKLDPADLSKKYQPVADAIKKLNVGQSIGIIEAKNRFFIVKLISRQDAKYTPFSEVQSEIEATIRKQRWTKYSNQLIDKLLRKATIGSMEDFVQSTAKAAGDYFKPQT